MLVLALDQAFDGRDGNMTFDEIPRDSRRVACLNFERHAQPFLDRNQVTFFDHLHLEARLGHSVGPGTAAAAVGVPVDVHLFKRGRGESRP